MILGFEVSNLERLSLLPIKISQGSNPISLREVYFFFTDERSLKIFLKSGELSVFGF